MAIRFANLQDVPALVECGRQMHALTRFRDQTYNAGKVGNVLTDILQRGQGKYAFFVAEDAQGGIPGGLIGSIEQPLFADHFVATVVYYMVLPQARMGGHGVRLLKAFEQWARNRKAIEINFGVNSGAEAEAVGRFARKMGYAKVGEHHVLRLS